VYVLSAAVLRALRMRLPVLGVPEHGVDMLDPPFLLARIQAMPQPAPPAPASMHCHPAGDWGLPQDTHAVPHAEVPHTHPRSQLSAPLVDHHLIFKLALRPPDPLPLVRRHLALRVPLLERHGCPRRVSALGPRSRLQAAMARATAQCKLANTGNDSTLWQEIQFNLQQFCDPNHNRHPHRSPERLQTPSQ
jgi:hypothetical protein